LLGPWRASRQVKSHPPLEEELPKKIFKYETFPKFDMSLFYAPRPVENY
jgi:hypothetical protein